MSDTIIFIVGIGVFAITIAATLLYGYTWFDRKAIADRVDVGEGWDAAGTTGEPASRLEARASNDSPRAGNAAPAVTIP